MKPRFYLTIGFLLLLAGLLFGYQPLLQYWQKNNKPVSVAIPTNSSTKVFAEQKIIQGKPTRIVIPSIGVDLQVADGIYNSKTKAWTLSNDKAHYALITPEPNNQSGNTFIYGHNRKQVFSMLSEIKQGEVVVIHTDNGHTFFYAFRESRETNPNDDSLFTYKGPPILTLQTCSGLWYQNRFLLTFNLVRAV